MGWVNINDPFIQQMQLWTTGTDEGPDKTSLCQSVPYDMFRPTPCPVDTTDETTDDAETTIMAETTGNSTVINQEPPRAPKRRMIEPVAVCGGPLNLQFHQGEPDHTSHATSQELAFVPCVNGILKVGSCVGSLTFENSKTDYTISKLWYDNAEKLAMTTMESASHKSVKVTLPSSMVHLRHSDYLLKVSKIIFN